MSQGLGGILTKMQENWKVWRLIFFAILIVMLALGFVLVNHHGHIAVGGHGGHEGHGGVILDTLPAFYGGFGLVVGLIMVIVMKKIVQPFIARKEDHYGD